MNSYVEAQGEFLDFFVFVGVMFFLIITEVSENVFIIPIKKKKKSEFESN